MSFLYQINVYYIMHTDGTKLELVSGQWLPGTVYTNIENSAMH